MTQRCRAALGVTIPVHELFSRPSIAALSKAVLAPSAAPYEFFPVRVPIRVPAKRAPFFASILSAGSVGTTGAWLHTCRPSSRSMAFRPGASTILRCWPRASTRWRSTTSSRCGASSQTGHTTCWGGHWAGQYRAQHGDAARAAGGAHRA